MLRSITLQNFKSFGERETVPLEPITICVGPNNSGKSNFVTIGRFVTNAAADLNNAITTEGGVDYLVHRPRVRNDLVVGWDADSGTYESVLQFNDQQAPSSLKESLLPRNPPSAAIAGGGSPFSLISTSGPYRDVFIPLLGSRLVKLSMTSLRRDAAVVPNPRLGGDGEGLAAVIGVWRGAEREKSDQLDEFLHRCVPEIRNVNVRPAPQGGFQRLFFKRTDGQEFDAEHISDGVLCFTALAMHAIDAPPGAVIFIEEPEQAIHPRRIHDLVDLLRTLVHQQKTQFVIATHSRVLVDNFRDEPESVVLFRWTETGTRVRRLADIPDLAEAPHRAPPGEMLETGFFNQPFDPAPGR